MEITYGRIQSAQKVVIYGPEGIGKSTFASRFPNALFIDTEGSTKMLNVGRLPAPQTWQDVLDEINYVANNPTCCKTLVIDTADWAEQQAISAICKRANKSGIEDFGYGKGYTYVSEEFQGMLRQLDKLIERGINVVITAHAKMRKFEQPDEMGRYDRWELKLSKQSAPLLKEWADMVLFANYKVYTVRTDDKKVKAQGGERTMYTSHHPCWDAKNRHGLPDEMPFTYESIRQIIEDGVPDTATSQPEAPTPQHTYVSKPPQVSMTEMMNDQPAEQPNTPAADVDQSLASPEQREPDIPDGIPLELQNLMRVDHVDACELQMVVSDKGYYPLDTPISFYDPDFIHGCLIADWANVFKAIKTNRDNLPF